MPDRTENLRMILGLKLRNLRLARGEPLRCVAECAGVSVSYLSELEQGKKYPKPDKLLRLATALEVAYDDLVSLAVDEELLPLKAAVSSGFLREFPFELFGLEREDLFRLISETPEKAGPLIQSLVEIGRSFDVQVEHFLLSALRAYQQMHANYFEDLERAAARFRRNQGWMPGELVDESALRLVLERDWGYRIDQATIGDHPDLAGFRSVYVEGAGPVLHVNHRLLAVQRAFVLAREIGYRFLGLSERPTTSSWIRVGSFAQVLSYFKASYFAGAVLMDRPSFAEELESLFSQSRWDPHRFRASMSRFEATPEMFLYRMTELVPQLFGLQRLFFVRFHRRAGSEEVDLAKVFNLSGVAVPHGIGFKEHYCRRWPGVQLVRSAESEVAVQRSVFFEQGVEFFVIACSRPLALDRQVRSSVSIGFVLDSRFKRRVRFWDDPEVSRLEVHLTCERCRLTEAECQERVAPAVLHRQRLESQRKELALEALAAGVPASG